VLLNPSIGPGRLLEEPRFFDERDDFLFVQTHHFHCSDLAIDQLTGLRVRGVDCQALGSDSSLVPP
jgi:hypothetical protein